VGDLFFLQPSTSSQANGCIGIETHFRARVNALMKPNQKVAHECYLFVKNMLIIA
jgi:hypothetical protein